MKTKFISPFIVALTLIFASCNPTSETNDLADLAERWVSSSYESKDAALKMVSENMSDQGYNIGARYIGFGFNFNADAMKTDGMLVTNVIKDSPASSVLQVGDKFIAVNGVSVTEESIQNGSLSFRGKPGVPVTASIMRNDKEISITVERGIVVPKYSKEQIIQNISSADAATWGENILGYEIREVVADNAQGIVYVRTWDKFLDTVSGP